MLVYALHATLEDREEALDGVSGDKAITLQGGEPTTSPV